MNKLPTCCEFHHKTECGQSDFCPARAAKHDGVMTMPTGCSLKALPDPAKQPLPVLDDDLAPVTKTEMLAVSVLVMLSTAALGYVAWQAARQIFN